MRKIQRQSIVDTLKVKGPFCAYGLAIILMFSNFVWAGPQDLPGLSIARLALPSISPQMSTPQPTGTPIGEKAIELKKTIIETASSAASHIQSTRKLYENAISQVNAYHLVIGEIEAKLQLGTTPANPKLTKLRDQALMKLDQISETINMMDSLANNFTNTSQEVGSLSLQIKETLLLPGALDEDHANLLLMAEELEGFKTSILQIRDILDGNTARQNEWLNAERTHFETLSLAVERGKSQFLSLHNAPLYPIPNTLPELSPALTVEPTPEPLELLPEAGVTQDIREEAPPSASQEDLPFTPVESHLVVQPLPEEEPLQAPPQSAKKPLVASQILADRQPLGLLTTDQQPQTQKWYLFAAAQRGLRAPTDKIEVVNVMKSESSRERGDEVVSLLIEMGIPSIQLFVSNVQADDNQPEAVYLFQKK